MSGRHRRRGNPALRRRMAATAIVTTMAPAAATFGATAASAAETPPAPQVDAGAFKGQASADGIRVTLAVKNYLIIEDFIDGGGPTARAVLDSLGESTAYSSLPYPGEAGVAVPGLISTVSGKSVPTYPFIVSSQYPSRQESRVTQPGYLMHAESNQTRSAAETSAGATTANGEEFGSFSTAAVNSIDGVLTSAGEARTRLAIGALSLNGAVSKASITRTPDGKVEKTTSFEASSLRLGDLQIGVTERGLIVGPQNAPLDPASSVSESVTKSGITVSFLPAVQTKDSVLSSGLVISTEQPLPNVGSAKGVVSYIVGRTYAQAQSAGGGVETAAPTTSTTPAGPVAETPAALDPVAEAPALGTPITEAPIVAAPAPAAAAPPAQSAPAEELPTVQIQTLSADADELTEIEFYPLLAALVPILLGAAVATRRFI